MSLFRTEAIEAQRSKYYGQILLAVPLGATPLTIVSVLLAGLFLAILGCGTYTQRQRVSGRLVPDTGMVSAFAPQAGTIVSMHVHEGQQVHSGDLLYIIKTPRSSAAAKTRARAFARD